MEYNRLKLEEGRVTAARVAESFIGNGKYGSSSINQTAQRTMCLPVALINIIRKIASTQDPHLCVQHKRMNQNSSGTAEEHAKVEDCRPFSRFHMRPH